MNFMVVTAVALWFDAIEITAHVIRMNTIKHGNWSYASDWFFHFFAQERRT